MAAHAYWRIYISEVQYGTTVNATEVQFRTAYGTSSVPSGGTPLSSTYYSGEGPEKAFDDDTGTVWTSNAAAPQYIGYQFASAIDVVEVSIASRTSWADRSPKNFSVDYSDDGSTWTEYVVVTGEPTWSSTTETRVYSILSLTGAITESSGITKWLVTATRASDGSLVGRTYTAADPSTYTIRVASKSASDRLCNLMLSAKVDYAWSASKVATLGDLVVASAPDTTPHLWEVTTAGTFGGTEASWNLSGTTTQGSAVLTYVAALPDRPLALGPKVPS